MGTMGPEIRFATSREPPYGKPEPMYVPFRAREVRVRHDDARLKPYTPMAAVLPSAASLASTVDGLRCALDNTVADRYAIDVPRRRQRGQAAAAVGRSAFPGRRSAP